METFDATPSGNDDALALFGPEGNTGAGPRAASSQRHAAVSREANTAADPDGVVSLQSVLESSPLRFVEGVAIVQALCAAVRARDGVNAGMPDLRGAFLSASGEIVAITPPTDRPAAPELARLLHRLVPTETTPPVGRLFVDRWAAGDSTDLAKFASELAYFARPNGPELLSAIHARCAGAARSLPLPAPSFTPSPARTEVESPAEVETRKEPAAAQEKPWQPWLRSHRRQIVGAAVVVTMSIVVTAFAAWFWPSKTAEAAQGSAQAAIAEQANTDANELPSDKPAPGAVATKASGPKIGRNARPVATPRAPLRPESPLPAVATSPAPAVSEAAFGETPPANLPATRVPDMRIYSAADSEVEPPKLRSAEILESLITGFPTRTNSVEVIISERGEVQRVRLQGPPQRIPDIMLLSRVKELIFDPATRNGTAVRYSLILSWNVTP